MARPRLHWGYMVLLAKFVHFAISTGVIQSFSIFIPDLVDEFETNYATIGLVCGLPETLGSLMGPLWASIIKRSTARKVAFVGAVICSGSLVGASFCTSVVTFGLCTAINGLGIDMTFMGTTVAINDHFPVKFGAVNALSIMGGPTGVFIMPLIAERLLTFYGRGS